MIAYKITDGISRLKHRINQTLIDCDSWEQFAERVAIKPQTPSPEQQAIEDKLDQGP